MGSNTFLVFEQVEVAKAEQTVLQPPPRYKVFLMNDDYTPMDFVVDVLERFFSISREQSVHLMLQVHHTGKAICGCYTKDIAETKVMQVNDYAKQNDHPLLCCMEADK